MKLIREFAVPRRGALVGYDVARGRVAWRVALGGDSLAYGGSTVTAGDVVFSGESSGVFDAHDARTACLGDERFGGRVH